MNYQTGDYIRFHTPEQWQQIVEKLERDGQKIYKKKLQNGVTAVVLDYDLDWMKYSRLSHIPYNLRKNDITDKFFEEVLQDELCNNPPLEEVENTFNNILAVNRKGDYVETVSVFSDHSEATFYYWKDCEVVGDVTLNKVELQHYVEKLQKMMSDMD